MSGKKIYEKYKPYYLEYYQKNAKRIREYSKEWYQRNKKWLQKVDREKKQAVRLEVLSHYSGGVAKCACCGEIEVEFLCIDHIHDNGNEHRRRLGNKGVGSRFFFWLKKNNFPEGFQVLCWNCNHAKGKLGLCPHKAIKVISPEINNMMVITNG